MERMMIILFRPFDLGKWFMIGFSAFLALFAEGGFSVNNPFSGSGRNDSSFAQSLAHPAAGNLLPIFLHQFKLLTQWLESLPGSGWFPIYIGLGLLYVLAWLAANWVGCRGQFVLLDNIVRNRAALAEPWRRYARQGNGWFLVHMVLLIISSAALIGLGVGFVALNWAWIDAERYPLATEVAAISFYLVVSLVLWLIFAAVQFLIRSFALPIYFQQKMGIVDAIMAVARITMAYPLDIFAYLFVSLVLTLLAGILALMVFCAFCCLICWFAFIPIVGSIALSFALCELVLPLLIFFRCFQLDCLAQLAPEYDAFGVDALPPTPGLA